MKQKRNVLELTEIKNRHRLKYNISGQPTFILDTRRIVSSLRKITIKNLNYQSKVITKIIPQNNPQQQQEYIKIQILQWYRVSHGV
jgi:hypothetical protein